MVRSNPSVSFIPARIRAMNMSAKIGIACIVSLLVLSGCQRQVRVTVKGNPLRPTFVFEEEIVLGVFSMDVTDPNGNKSNVKDVWGIARVPNAAYYHTQRLEYGIVPPGFTEYIPAKTRDLKANRLYAFTFSNGGTRGGGAFAVVERKGELTIVQFDEKKIFDEIITEYLELIKAEK